MQSALAVSKAAMGPIRALMYSTASLRSTVGAVSPFAMRKNVLTTTKGGLCVSGRRNLMHSMVQVSSFVTHLRVQRAMGDVRTRRDAIQVVGLGAVRHTTGGNGKVTKTKKAAAKRFLVTGKGKLKRGRCGMRHNTGHRTSKAKRLLGSKTLLSGAQAKKMSMLIMNSK